MRRLLSLGLLSLLSLHAVDVAAQRAQRRNRPRVDTPSVVMVPESQKQVVDTALLLPEEKKSRSRRFRVRMVPAPPPGRSRQEILYSDSLGRR